MAKENRTCGNCTHFNGENAVCKKGYFRNYGSAESVAHCDYFTIKALEQEPCEDCISREQVISGIDRYIDKAQSTGTRDDFISFQELVVKQLPPVTPTQRWIPVKTRLPQNRGTYLVTVDEFVEQPPSVEMLEYSKEKGFHDVGGMEYGALVIAWAEVPEPYKGVE
ncbi:MAG: hypothetical protein K6A05_04895 [Lachnospiraceae bacterium]|nr:hypothetical protein [Lachnospiraceae bacterium]